MEQIKYLNSTWSKENNYTQHKAKKILTLNIEQNILTLDMEQRKFLPSTWSKENTYTQHGAKKILTLNMEQRKYLHST